jgi:hypothetical protein
MPEELQAELLALQQQTQAGGSSDGASTSACTSASAYATGQKRPYGSGAAVSGSQQQEELPGSRTAAVQEVDNSYFDSYSGFGIHQEMLSDKVRHWTGAKAGHSRDALCPSLGMIMVLTHDSLPWTCQHHGQMINTQVMLVVIITCHVDPHPSKCSQGQRHTGRPWSAIRPSYVARQCWTSAVGQAFCQCLQHVEVCNGQQVPDACQAVMYL